MKKKLWLFLLVSFIVWNVYPYVDHAEETKAVSNDPNNDSSKLNKQIESIQADLKDLKEDKKLSTDTMSKEDLYNALLDREKDVSSSLYNFTMFFVSFVALAVAIGVIYFGKLARDLKEHQKKIDLVMDSKEFDEKMSNLQKKLSEVEAKERLASEKSLERYIKDCVKRAELVVIDIYELKKKDFFTEEAFEILQRSKYTYYKNYLASLNRRYIEYSKKVEEKKHGGLTPYDHTYYLIIQEYTEFEGRYEEIANELEKIHREVVGSMATGENK
ncbi:hypothetical protein COJ90_21015 [Priestia megaterium]|uniref:FlxA-like family protein n=1 Tax=Priestia megaterium TaxID=1404 RepID=UPI000BF3A8B7|nr:FlxA-like family protein [Priestia megaterium]PFP09387.1 hypothetical protein COJ90_21015 [Priestia megaterium]